MSDNTHPAGEDGRYPQVVRSVLETPWAILPRTLATIKELVATRASGYRFTEEEIAARIGAKPARKDTQRSGQVAVIPVYGVITPKADMFTDMSGGTSIDRLRGAFLDAVEDPQVGSIVLDVDSPGGQVDMVPEFAADIRGARGTKPIYAVANTLAASAAYWIASQANEVFVTQSGEVGSIGVFAAHDDYSGALEKAGVKTTLVSAGKFKTEANPFEPLSDEARAAIQARVDEAYRMFTQDVARGRGIAVDAIRGGFGEGRVMVSREALAEGMVDGIATLDEVIARAARSGPGTTGEAVAFAQSYVEGHRVLSAASTNQPRTGLTIVGQLEALRDSALEMAELLPSLAEVKEGRLTKAKREPLTACPGALRDAADALESVLAATNPSKQRATVDTAMLNDIARRHELANTEVPS